MISQSPYSIVIGWVAPQSNGMPLLGYEIYWNGLNTSGVNYTLLASVNPTIASYNISTVVPGYTYRFKLIAMN